MKKELSKILESIPDEVEFNEIVDFDSFDERLSAVGSLFANIISVTESCIEFYSDNQPPLREEKLSWIWSFRPDLANELLEMNLSEGLKILIESYRDSDMRRFWEFMI